MFLPISRLDAALAVLLLTSCSGGGESSAEASADEGRIDCAMGGADSFDRTCTLARMTSADGTILVVGREGAGYRRLLLTNDGRGVIAADGAVAATVTIIRDGMIEVEIGGDRFRLPADTDGTP